MSLRESSGTTNRDSSGFLSAAPRKRFSVSIALCSAFPETQCRKPTLWKYGANRGFFQASAASWVVVYD